MKEHQARADTAKFPTPFEFSFIDSSSLLKDQLFSKANLWLATTVKNMNLDVAKDSSAGKIILPNVQSSHSAQYQYNITIDVRDNKYRLIINDIKAKGLYDAMIPIADAEKEKGFYFGTTKTAFWNNEKLYLKDEAYSIFESLKKYIQSKDDF